MSYAIFLQGEKQQINGQGVYFIPPDTLSLKYDPRPDENTWNIVSQTEFVGKVVLDFIISEITTTCNIRWSTREEGFPISYLNFILL